MKDLSGLTLFQARILGLKTGSVILLGSTAYTVTGFRNQRAFYAKRVLPYRYYRPAEIVVLPTQDKRFSVLLAETDEECAMVILGATVD